MMVEYGADRKLSKHNKLGVWLSAGYPNGVLLKVRCVVLAGRELRFKRDGLSF